MVANIVGCLLLFPGAIFAISAGLIFGTFESSGVIEFLLFVLGSFVFLNIQALSGLIVFNFSRLCLRQKIRESFIETNERLMKFDKILGIYGTKALFLMRLSPLLPVSLFNYISGGFNSNKLFTDSY